ncbi:DUF6497 family protein [Gemmobacter serpentinus]|uniref:DUF6497 family protein n=1 Tax=Gemmobacter serpentinus TaxID=2652247 RepID=UPI00124ED595|nr:DUF6497 family protein [Gemmobacter serpentinus]
MTGQALSEPSAGEVLLEGDAAPIAVPSGQAVVLQNVIRSEDGAVGPVLRFRFVAPQIAEGVDFDTASADMLALCQSFALPRLTALGATPRQVVISLSAMPTPFGEVTPDVTQYFEAYRIENGTCIWEMF